MQYIRPQVTLYPNQLNNVRALLSKRRALFTDHVGSGKTLSILAALSILFTRSRIDRVLVFMPLSAYRKDVWSSDISKFTMFRAVTYDEFTKNPTLHLKDDIIMFKHTALKKDFSSILSLVTPKTLIVIDEVHALRNPRTELTSLYRALLSNVKFCWGMTGTAMSRSIEDTFNIIDLLVPNYLGSFYSFRNKFCNLQEKVIGKINNQLRKVLIVKSIKNELALRSVLDPVMVYGKSFVELNFHFVKYELSNTEQLLYKKVANGIGLYDELSNEDWLQAVLKSNIDDAPAKMKSVEQYSTRFIYLQSICDGVLQPDGTFGMNVLSSKLNKLHELCALIKSRGQSAVIYVEFYHQVDAVKKILSDLDAVILESSGRNVLDSSALSPAKVKLKTHFIIGTRASSESQSLYYINNAILFNVPTVSSVFIQFTGRISRKNTLFPGDLNCWIFNSVNIDDYKLRLVSNKTAQLEKIQNYEEFNVPDIYKYEDFNEQIVKRTLLWRNYL